MMGALALMMMAQSGTLPPAPIARPAPRFPPPIKSGSFSCAVLDRKGERFTLSGTIGQWQSAGGDGDGRAVLDLKVPEKKGFSGLYSLTLRRLEMSIGGLNLKSNSSISGTLTNASYDIATASYAKDGMIMLKRTVLDGSTSKDLYVGFCDMALSADSREVSQ